jgi:hypothetical protein
VSVRKDGFWDRSSTTSAALPHPAGQRHFDGLRISGNINRAIQLRCDASVEGSVKPWKRETCLLV